MQYDYVIVGAGSGGCALASRLAPRLLVARVRVASAQPRRILDAPSLALHGGIELYTHAGQSDAELRRTIAEHADTIYHPVATCRMGGDAQSVVDPQLRVRGVTGLRIVDASVMPILIGSNTNSPTMMIGERAAELIAASRRDRQAARKTVQKTARKTVQKTARKTARKTAPDGASGGIAARAA